MRAMDEIEAPDVHAGIEHLEARIGELRDEAESCRKAILASRIAGALGGVYVAAFLLGFAASVPGFFLAIAACLGGIVWAGSSHTTRAQKLAECAACIDERNALIDSLGLRTLH